MQQHAPRGLAQLILCEKPQGKLQGFTVTPVHDKALAMHCAVSSERNAETFRRFLYGSSGLRAVSRKRNCPGVCCVSNQERRINPSCPGAENAVSHCLRAGEYAVSSTGGV